MTPYYQDDLVTIYHGDCRDVLPTLGPFDLAFADPPYNSGLSYGAGTNDDRLDYWPWLGERIDAMTENAATVLVKHSALKLAEFMARWPSRVIVWYKPFSSGFPLGSVTTHWEPLHLLKGQASKPVRDVVEVSSGNSNPEDRTGHPAQFPEKLARWIVGGFTPSGGTLVDPFAGSGTMLVAAKDFGRHAIGIEIEERYCEIAATRCSQEVLGLAV